MQFGFMSERGTIDVVFILRMMQEEYHAKGRKLYMQNILVVWFECRFQVTDVDGSNPGNSMLFP